MPLPALTLICNAATTLSLNDERARVEAGRMERGVLASATLDGTSTTWGEGLTYTDVLAIHAWTGELLAAVREGLLHAR